MSCRQRGLLARFIAGIKSSEVRKELLRSKDLTLKKAVCHIQLDEATSIQASKFSSKVSKTAASAYKRNKTNWEIKPDPALYDLSWCQHKLCRLQLGQPFRNS